MATTFDATVLFVYRNETSYTKLCFERAPKGYATHCCFGGDETIFRRHEWSDCRRYARALASESLGTRYRVSHYSTDEKDWKLFHLFRLFDPDASTWVGFMAQAPVGDGCKEEFDRIHYSEGAIKST